MSVRAEIEKPGRIWVRAGYPIAGLHKDVPGSNFSKTDGPHWSCPLSMEAARLLRERFGSALEIGPKLWDWGKAARAKESRMRELAGASAVELPHLWSAKQPRLYWAVTQGRPYQSVGAAWIREGRAVILGDEVGLGKTLQAMAGTLEAEVSGPYLVVCPKTAVEVVWAPEIRHWLDGHTVITTPEGRAKRDAILNGFAAVAADPATSSGREGSFDLSTTWVVVHPDMIRTKSFWLCRGCGSETPVNSRPKELKCGHDPQRSTLRHDHTFPQLFGVDWGAVIVDEADQGLLRLSGIPTQLRNGLDRLRIRPEGLRIGATGTPFRSRPHLLWGLLNWLWPDIYTAFWSWAESLFEVQKNHYGGREIGRLRPDREHLLYGTLDQILLRRTAAEVMPEKPTKQYIGTHLVPGDESSPLRVWLPMEPAQERAYREMEKTSSARLEGGYIEAIGSLAELTRCKQFAIAAGRLETTVRNHKCKDPDCPRKREPHSHREEIDQFYPALPSNKLTELIRILTELGYPEDPQTKVVVASQFTKILSLFRGEIEKWLGAGSCVSLTGEITGKARATAVDAFNEPIGNGSPTVMFLNTKAGGSSITLDMADEMVILDETWISDDQVQLEGRIDNRRPEVRIAQRRYRYLCSRGTVEVGIAVESGEQRATTVKILDGRRGVEFARRVFAASG